MQGSPKIISAIEHVQSVGQQPQPHAANIMLVHGYEAPRTAAATPHVCSGFLNDGPWAPICRNHTIYRLVISARVQTWKLDSAVKVLAEPGHSASSSKCKMQVKVGLLLPKCGKFVWGPVFKSEPPHRDPSYSHLGTSLPASPCTPSEFLHQIGGARFPTCMASFASLIPESWACSHNWLDGLLQPAKWMGISKLVCKWGLCPKLNVPSANKTT